VRSKYSGSSDSARDKRGGGGGGGGVGEEKGSSKGLCDLKDVEIKKTRLKCEEVVARSHKELNYRKFLGQPAFTC